MRTYSLTPCPRCKSKESYYMEDNETNPWCRACGYFKDVEQPKEVQFTPVNMEDTPYARDLRKAAEQASAARQQAYIVDPNDLDGAIDAIKGALDILNMVAHRAAEQRFLALTRLLAEHPEGYDGPCECGACMAYGAEDGDCEDG